MPEDATGMQGKPRLFLWNYTDEEKARVDEFLREVKAPPAVAISKDQGYLPVKDIIHREATGAQELDCDEKLMLFYNIPSRGIAFLIDQAKQRNLPRPLYAAVTEESIHWPLNELLTELIKEREAFESMS
ncbi:DUF3783 domain-containing protein [candidate division KSB3 bacterium]|jgi:hypothetical protein|uniref:DUF3783 domain-containing protein n=1 Tax=candidate division KSB3 bacterium TaxID=2044937 RepID=A0A9D5JX33_9BACT|nr:DUF3783 domain-containing protein [candidate division KSB3 bacterium]MBD3325729.1 DUF3783 domain-containing protein [candidate division KSB3 bacterium]